jgi:hypothetical protein
MRSKFAKTSGETFYCNPKATRQEGCGYKFGPGDLEIHQRAAKEREPGLDLE